MSEEEWYDTRINFSRDARGRQKYHSLSGELRNTLPRLINSEVRLGNYRDLVEARIENTNKNDQKACITYMFTLPGNPVLSKYGEYVFVNDLEHPDMEVLRKEIYEDGGNSFRRTFRDKALNISSKDYDIIRSSKATFVLEARIASELNQQNAKNDDVRRELFEYLCQNDSELTNKYLRIVQEARISDFEELRKNVHDYEFTSKYKMLLDEFENQLNRQFIYINLNEFQGMRFLESGNLQDLRRRGNSYPNNYSRIVCPPLEANNRTRIFGVEDSVGNRRTIHYPIYNNKLKEILSDLYVDNNDINKYLINHLDWYNEDSSRYFIDIEPFKNSLREELKFSEARVNSAITELKNKSY
jgi:hypothetical protein